MAFDFPSAPTVGQKYPTTPVVGMPTYTWDGQKWTTAGQQIGNYVYYADTAPANPPDGALWWETDTGNLFLRYNDGNSSAWVQATAVPLVSSSASSVSSIGGAVGAITLQSGMSVVGNKLAFMDVGTVMTFQQSASPTGWTKQTVHNDKALRVVSGAASSGGTLAFSTVFSRTADDPVTLSLSTTPAHGHGINDPGHGHYLQSPSGGAGGQYGFVDSLNSGSSGQGPTTSNYTGISGTLNNGSSGPHQHGMDIRVQYVDLILASKDA